MSETHPQSNGDISATVGGVHQFGTASESLFRRLYRRLNRQQQFEEEIRRQRSGIEELQRNVQRLESAQRQRASELERLHGLLGSLDEGIILQDPNGKVTMMNQAAQDMLGGKRAFWDSALGTFFERFRDVQETTADLTPLGESDEFPLNNRIVQAQLIAIGDENRRRIGTLIILRDVTHDALAVRLKDGFVTHIAREMESPISVIKLATELLSGQPEDATLNERLLDKLLRNVSVLDQLALELIDISRMNAGTFDVKREPVRVEEIIWSVVNGIDPDIKSRGIDLLVMARGMHDVQVRGDDTRLQWALAHLIRNGADFNREGGYVAIAARIETHDSGEYAVISVSDNGSGINQSDLPHIFERFYRGDAGDLPPGLGQGLFVAKAIGEAHGGFLRVNSRERIGSIFTLGLPILRAPRATA